MKYIIDKLYIILFFIILISCDKTFERKNVLLILLSEPVMEIHPHFAKSFDEITISNLIARSLFSYDLKEKKNRNEIAESYNFSEDGKQWRIKIKKNLVLSNNEKINADLIIENFNNFLFKSPKNIYFQNIQSIKKENEYEIKITLKKPDFEFITLLAGRNRFGIVSLKNNNEIIGSGPYILISKSFDEIILEKNNNYNQSLLVETKKIIFKFISSEDERLNQILNRKADITIINNIKNINEIMHKPFLRLTKKINSPKIILIANKSKFNNQNIFNAIFGYSLFRNKIAYSFYTELAESETNILPSYALNYNKTDHLLFYNPEEVKNKLIDNNIISFNIFTQDDLVRFNKVLELWKIELKKYYNININIKRLDKDNIITYINHNNFDAAFLVYNNFIIHPRDIVIFFEIFKNNELKKTLISNDFFELIEKALKTKNTALRNLFYFRASERLTKSSNIIGIINLSEYFIGTDKIQNIEEIINGKYEKIRVYK